jgi:DNA-directed RNA polymerase specialized sigma24 family protein
MTRRVHRGDEGDRHPADRALVEYWVAGEEPAFAELLARYRGVVYAVAYAALTDPERAETVVAETFDEARRTAATFLDTAASVSGWLTHLARVCVASHSKAIPAGRTP